MLDAEGDATDGVIQFFIDLIFQLGALLIVLAGQLMRRVVPAVQEIEQRQQPICSDPCDGHGRSQQLIDQKDNSQSECQDVQADD